MQTSATGRRAPREAGFTLIELMVVITILGLTAAVVVFNALPSGPNARAEAEQLAARLDAARTLAITANTDTALLLTDTGYSFEQRRPAGWQSPLIAGPRIAGPRIASHEWPQGLPVSANIEGGGRLRFDSTGLATPATITLGPARVTVSSAGEIRVE